MHYIWGMLPTGLHSEDCGEVGPDVIGYGMDHITSSVMLFIVHVDFRPEYINFQVMNTRKRLFSRGAISINTCNIHVCKTVTECLLLKEHSDRCALRTVVMSLKCLNLHGYSFGSIRLYVCNPWLKGKFSLLYKALGLQFVLPPNILPITLCPLLFNAKVLGVYGDDDSRFLSFMDMLSAWVPVGSLKKESIREDLGNQLNIKACHIMVKVYKLELELLNLA